MPTLAEQVAAQQQPPTSPQADIVKQDVATQPPAKLPVAPPTISAPDIKAAQDGLKSFEGQLDALRDKLATLRAQYLQWGGRVGCNPHFYLHETLRPQELALFRYETESFSSIQEKWNFAQNLLANIGALEYNEKFIIKDPVAYKAELARQAEVARIKSVGPQPPRVVSGGV